ncbi:cilia- and flagella-associated protein HOATZ [Salarias fasciatus]|uniref:cilia- and flagella-associated protein HOATZ n=1 Tax=Salarias fasciatus TaxID=181472 RepID=UPI001176850D|nr:UPF0722 protein C11orf88 homolog [Salarias fasciatus]
MSVLDPPDLQQLFTVFQGSSPEDVSHARRFWSSMALLPPLESRLVSADIRQRLPVSRPQRRGSSAAAAGHRAPPPAETPPELLEERRRYEAMADQRKEILALLRRQRERRIRRELPREAWRLYGVRRMRMNQLKYYT